MTTSELVLETITRTGDKVLVDLTVDTDGAAGDENTTLTATDNHGSGYPTWASGSGRATSFPWSVC